MDLYQAVHILLPRYWSGRVPWYELAGLGTYNTVTRESIVYTAWLLVVSESRNWAAYDKRELWSGGKNSSYGNEVNVRN